MLAIDFPTTCILLCAILLAQVANGRPADECYYPQDFISACQQRNTRSIVPGKINNEGIDQISIAIQHMDNFEKAFKCTDPSFTMSAAKNMTVETMPQYLKEIEMASREEVIMRLSELLRYITEVQTNTSNNYTKNTMCYMSARIQATLHPIANQTLVAHKINNKDTLGSNRIKEMFNMTDSSKTQANRQGKVIFTIFHQLYLRLNVTEIHLSETSLDSKVLSVGHGIRHNHCDYPQDFINMCPSVSALSNSGKLNVNIRKFEKALKCADASFSSETAKNMTKLMIPDFLRAIHTANRDKLVRRFKELLQFIKEVQSKSSNHYTSTTLCNMALRIQSTLAQLLQRNSKNSDKRQRIKELLRRTDNDMLDTNEQVKVIFTIFQQLYKRLKVISLSPGSKEVSVEGSHKGKVHRGKSKHTKSLICNTDVSDTLKKLTVLKKTQKKVVFRHSHKFSALRASLLKAQDRSKVCDGKVSETLNTYIFIMNKFVNIFDVQSSEKIANRRDNKKCGDLNVITKFCSRFEKLNEKLIFYVKSKPQLQTKQL